MGFSCSVSWSVIVIDFIFPLLVLLKQTSGMPHRLKTLVETTEMAKDYSKVISALSNTLGGMNEQLHFFQWHWKNNRALQEVKYDSSSWEGPLLLPQRAEQLKKSAEEKTPNTEERGVTWQEHAENAPDEDEVGSKFHLQVLENLARVKEVILVTL